MKQISLIAMLSAIALPVFAEDAPKAEQATVTEEPIMQEIVVNKPLKLEKASNPKTKFPHGLQFGLGASVTSGLNMFIGYNNKDFDSFWAKRFGVRFDFATVSPIKSSLNKRINSMIGEDGIEIDDNLKVDNASLSAKHFGLLVDFYPFGDTWFLGGLRLSGGYMTGNLDLSADIQGTRKVGHIEFEFGGKKYTYDGDTMRGKADVNWKYRGPYLGTGFDLGMFAGFKMYLDAGVVFVDKNATINLDVPLDGLKDINGTQIIANSSDPTIQAAYAEYENAKAKALSDAQNELDKIDWYPLVKIGFMYRF